MQLGDIILFYIISYLHIGVQVQISLLEITRGRMVLLERKIVHLNQKQTAKMMTTNWTPWL